MKMRSGCGLALAFLASCSSGTGDNSGPNTVVGSQGFGVQSAYMGRDDSAATGNSEIGIYLVDVGITCEQAAQRLVRPNKVVHLYVASASGVGPGAFAITPTDPVSTPTGAGLSLDVLATATTATQNFKGQSGTVTLTAFSRTEVSGLYQSTLNDSAGTTVSGTFRATYCAGLGK